MRYSMLAVILIGTGLAAWTASLPAQDAEEQTPDVYYVQSHRAAVFEDPHFGAEPLDRLDQGMAVERLTTENSWHRIRIGDLEGWMPGMLLRKEPPTQRQSHVDEAAALESSARRRASAVTTAGAIRGVEENERLLDDPNLDIEQLLRLEAQKVEPEEALEFLEEGEETEK